MTTIEATFDVDPSDKEVRVPTNPSPAGPATAPRRWTAAAAAALLVAAAGCSGDSEDTSGNGEPDPVTYLTGFGASAHDAFIWVAQDKGYFADADLEVDVQLGGGSQNYHELLADQADFTYIDYTGMMIDIGRGDFESTDFRALSSVHQSTLVAIVAPESSGITSPQDLDDASIGAFAGSPTELLLPAYAELSGWDFDEEQVVQSSPQELFGLLAGGEVDVLSTFIIQRGVIESTIGEPVVDFPFNQELDDLLGTGLVSTSALADEDPDLVTRFRDAALEGLRYTLDNPEEAIQIMQEQNPGAVDQVEPLVGQIELMRPYIEGEDEIGAISDEHMMRCITVLESAGLVPPASVTPEDIIGDETLTS